jgi:hypothetical protein
MRSVSSVLAVPTKRSAKQFALGQKWRDPHGVDPGSGKDSVERGGELAGAVADEEPEGGSAVVKIHQQVAGLPGCPGSGRVGGGAEDMHVAAANFDGEEDVDPFQSDRAIDVEEVDGQHGRGLHTQESAPRCVGGPQRCRRDPPPLEDSADRGCADAVAELEEFALDALVAQVSFSRAIRSISAAIDWSMGGRPERFG